MTQQPYASLGGDHRAMLAHFNSTVRDSDFNLSQSEGTTNTMAYPNSSTSMVTVTEDQLRVGDSLYTDCKDVFMDL